MNGILKSGLLVGVFTGIASLGACSASSSGGGAGAAGTGAGYGTGGAGNTGGANFGGVGNTGGGNTGGVGNTGNAGGVGGGNTGGVGNTGNTGGVGGSNTGGVGNTGAGGGTGGGGTVTLPAGCVTDSTVTVECNPITNAGCTGAGEACDYGQDQQGNTGLSCFPPPNDVPPNGSCDNQSGPYCQPKYHCAQSGDAGAGACKRFCCATSDCGGSGTCTPFSASLGTLGVCI
jgi:hypothetical protein